MKAMHKYFLKAVIALSLFLGACNQLEILEDIDKVTYGAEYAIPLINTQISIGELLEDFEENSTLFVDPDGTLRFLYKGNVISQNSDQVFAPFYETLETFSIIPLFSDNQALPLYDQSGLEIQRIDIKQGEFIYYFRNPHLEPVEVTIRLPQVSKEGEILTFTGTIPPYSGEGEEPFTTNLFSAADITDYLVSPDAAGNIQITYEAKGLESGSPLLLPSAYVSFQEVLFAYAEGFFANQLYPGGSDTIHIDFFENWTQGEVFFKEPKVNFYIENSFGIPTQALVERFEVTTVRSEVLSIRSELVDNGIDFEYPTLDEIGETKSTAFTFTKDNSNIDSLLGAGPVSLFYDVDILTSPGSETDVPGFITDSSFYKVNVEVELPLFGNARNFIARDTFAIDFSGYGEVSEAEFKLVTENNIPLAVDVQGYFQGERGVVLDSLFSEPQRVAQAAPVDTEGFVTQTTEKESFAEFSAERFKPIKGAKQLLIIASFSTTNDGDVPVRVLGNQLVDLRIGAKLKIER